MPKALPQLVEQCAQRQQVDRTEGCRAGSNTPKVIRGINVGKISRDPAKPAGLVVIGNPVVGPMQAATQQLNRLASQRMEGVRDPHHAAGRTYTTCS